MKYLALLTILAFGCVAQAPPGVPSGPHPEWEPVTANELKQGLSYTGKTTYTLSLASEKLVLDSSMFIKPLDQAEADCPEKVHTEPLSTDDSVYYGGTTTTLSPYVLYKTVSPLPKDAYGSIGTAPDPELEQEKTYYLKVEKDPVDPTTIYAKLYVKMKGDQFEQGWRDGYDAKSGDPAPGIATYVTVTLPGGPSLGYTKEVATSLDPCGAGQ
jgi:hypothetical protein